MSKLKVLIFLQESNLGPVALGMIAVCDCWVLLPSGAAETATIRGTPAATAAPPPATVLLPIATGAWTTLALFPPRRMLGFLEDESSLAWSSMSGGGGTRSKDAAVSEPIRLSGSTMSALSSSMMTMFLGISLNWYTSRWPSTLARMPRW